MGHATVTALPRREPDRWWNKAAYFNHNNRNKYGITLDLQTARGRELALRLVAMTDMVFENYRADVIGKLGSTTPISAR